MRELSGLEKDPPFWKKAWSMIIGIAGSRLLGLIREVLFASFFDRSLTDLWYVGFRIPNLFRRLLAEGGLNPALMPVLKQYQTRGQGLPFWRSFWTYYSGLVLILIFFLFLTFPIWVQNVADPNFIQALKKQNLDPIKLWRWMFWVVWPLASYGAILGVAQTLGNFGRSALAAAGFNLGLIIVQFLTVIVSPGWKGWLLTWGTVLAGFIPFFWVKNIIQQKGYDLSLSLRWYPEILSVGVRMLPSLLNLGVTQWLVFFNMSVATALGIGITSYLNWVDRILELPLAFVGVSISNALLASSRFNPKEDVDKISGGLGMAFFLLTPAFVALIVLPDWIISILFERGAFGRHESVILGQMLQAQATLMFSTPFVRIVSTVFYIRKDTWTPFLAALLAVTIHVVFLAHRLANEHGAVGLSLSIAISGGLQAIFLLIALWVRRISLDWKQIFQSITRTVIPGLGLCGFWILTKNVSFLEHPDQNLRSLGLKTVVLVMGVVIYFILSVWFKHPWAMIFWRGWQTKKFSLD